jgi:hypothetical protein
VSLSPLKPVYAAEITGLDSGSAQNLIDETRKTRDGK